MPRSPRHPGYYRARFEADDDRYIPDDDAESYPGLPLVRDDDLVDSQAHRRRLRRHGAMSGRDRYDRYGQPYDERQQRRNFMDRASDEVASWFGDETAERRREADHSGKGPRGYRRPDARIEEDVNDRLTDDPQVDATDVEVTVQEGEVTLTGYVDSRRTKRHAEDCADSVSGVIHVQNNLRVRGVQPAGAP